MLVKALCGPHHPRTAPARVGTPPGHVQHRAARRLPAAVDRQRPAMCGNVWVMSASVVSPVFVGRRDEMAALAAPMRLARGGAAAFALIGGEAGVGKTRLVGELAAQAAEAGFTVLIGH